MSLLEDLVASHKLLCQAALQTAAIGADSGFLPSSKSPQASAKDKPQASAESPYLTDDEENQLAAAYGLDQTPSPLMDKVVENQFQALFKHRQAMSQDPSAPKPMSAQTRPRIIAPHVELTDIAPKRETKASEPEPDLQYEEETGQAFEESEDIPLEIRFMDDLTKEKEKVEAPPRRRAMPKDVLSDFEHYLQTAGG